MTNPLVEREQVRRVERLLPDRVPVESVEFVRPKQSPYNKWTFEAGLQDADGVPPEVMKALARAGLTLRKTPTQGENERFAATV